MKIYIFVVKLWVENFLFCPDKNLAKSPNDLAARLSLHMSEAKKVGILPSDMCKLNMGLL